FFRLVFERDVFLDADKGDRHFEPVLVRRSIRLNHVGRARYSVFINIDLFGKRISRERIRDRLILSGTIA
ncbi:MAG: hypothetical protein AAFR70_15670, partial [Pseudomonadota bacterium]